MGVQKIVFEGDSVIEVHGMNLKNKKNSSVGHLAREVEAQRNTTSACGEGIPEFLQNLVTADMNQYLNKTALFYTK